MTTAVAQSLDIVQIKKILPHRYPFLLVDRVTELVPGQRAVGYKNLTANEEFFNGHFPDKPIMPGVLMVEALAQLGCICMLSLDELKGSLGLFTGVQSMKFRTMVQPGDKLDLSVELTKRKGPLGYAKVVAKVDDKIACEGEISFVFTKVETTNGTN